VKRLGVSDLGGAIIKAAEAGAWVLLWSTLPPLVAIISTIVRVVRGGGIWALVLLPLGVGGFIATYSFGMWYCRNGCEWWAWASVGPVLTAGVCSALIVGLTLYVGRRVRRAGLSFAERAAEALHARALVKCPVCGRVRQAKDFRCSCGAYLRAGVRGTVSAMSTSKEETHLG
jgi:hypothetical protein